MYADELTHLFIEAETCHAKSMSTYISLDEKSKRCVKDCMKTDKPYTHNGECLSSCPEYYYS
jgi:hypothetical protein